MFNKLISILVALTIFFSTAPAFAQEQVASIKEGQKAPFAGLIFNVAASAKMKVDKENATEQCRIEKDRELALAKAKSDLDIGNLNASVIAVQKRLDETMVLKNDQITFLNTHIEKQNEKLNKRKNLSGLYVGLGVLGGVLITIAAGYAIGQVK